LSQQFDCRIVRFLLIAKRTGHLQRGERRRQDGVDDCSGYDVGRSDGHHWRPYGPQWVATDIRLFFCYIQGLFS
jgi:hypothetical protein